ncbi:mediator of RNA polymerase II transcription subunit 31 isoform X2 [Anthonomus grandis grandis]|uniref:mediator of RNA polymerase II transcription subunit 31 isoform X2 n=1 Tax=Anthonomus grandis grandis TaxID=2921223 RepID=UPI002166B22E|nr:mediator of RNA polymerase II transcription subunit 31 isoform X2 [Anthonomus grandis grandis]
MAGMAGKGWSYVPGVPETEDQQKIRFQVELEFVQCLGNPNYLNFLAQRGFMKESTFINYLKYLLYWKEPEYAKELVNAQCTKFIDDQQILLWQHYTRRRSRLMATAAPNGANQEQNTSLPPSNAQQNGHINMNTKMS